MVSIPPTIVSNFASNATPMQKAASKITRTPLCSSDGKPITYDDLLSYNKKLIAVTDKLYKRFEYLTTLH